MNLKVKMLIYKVASMFIPKSKKKSGTGPTEFKRNKYLHYLASIYNYNFKSV